MFIDIIKRHHYIKKCLIYTLRCVLKIFYIFPIKKRRILFSSYEGRTYSCSPKYIFELLYQEFGSLYEYVWGVNDKTLLPHKYNVIVVKYLSFKFLFYSMTSKIIINNVGIEPILPKRKSQIFINTWHGGGAYKKGKPNEKYLRTLRSKMTDYVLSSCRRFSEIVSQESFLDIDESKVLPIGMPRNDLFFKGEQYQEIRNRICQIYGLDKNKILVLYAPTHRGTNHFKQSFNGINDEKEITDIIKCKFKKDAILLYRAHLETSFLIQGAVNVSDYPDMQELLVAVDILITDYSSSIWDYSLTYKPCFLFTPDLHQYIQDVGFYTPIDLWPYPSVLTMDDLCSNIRNYEESAAIEKIKNHHALLGSYETGTATEQVCSVIRQCLQ